MSITLVLTIALVIGGSTAPILVGIEKWCER